MTTNDRIKALMAERNLTSADVADLLGVSKHTVDSWRSKSAAKRRTMPKPMLELLEIKLLISRQGKSGENT